MLPLSTRGAPRVGPATQRVQDPEPSLGFYPSALRKSTIPSSPWYASASPEETLVARAAEAPETEGLNYRPAPPLTFYMTLDRRYSTLSAP